MCQAHRYSHAAGYKNGNENDAYGRHVQQHRHPGGEHVGENSADYEICDNIGYVDDAGNYRRSRHASFVEPGKIHFSISFQIIR